MISEDAIKARLKTLGPLDDAEAVFAAGLPALRDGAQGGEWFAIKAPRQDETINNTVRNGELNTKLTAEFGAEGEETDAAPTVALEAIARAILAEAVTGEDRQVALGEDEYELQFATPKKGGRTQIRLRNPAAGAAEDGEDGGEGGEG